MRNNCIIIGASHAACQLAFSLRQEGWEGGIHIIGDEDYLPYQRPPLSKTYILGETNEEELLIRPEKLYEKHNIKVSLGTRVGKIDRSAQTITLTNKDVLPYHRLAICTGSRVRKVKLKGSELEGVHYLRDISDVKKIKASTSNAKNAVIIGGGYIGLETAASLRKSGLEVTVLEMAPRVLERVTAPEISEFYTRVHSEEGVVIKTNVAVSEITGSSGKVETIVCSDNTAYPADLVVIGIGIIPNIELAEESGLDIDNGISVNEFAQTSDPNIVAAGDCTNHPNSIYGKLRLESVPNAMEQAKTAAATLCGKQKPYDSLPWFWSDQFDLKLQIAGLNRGYDQVVIRGDQKQGRSFAAFYLKDKKLLATDCINRPQEFMISKRLIPQQKTIDADNLANEEFDLKGLL
ncbi:NAD(P)/FAD-dependent oxidoreductase [Aurantivibrio infirmus]